MSPQTEILCCYNQLHELYSAYMPFVVGGGLFVKTQAQYNLGDLLAMRVQLLQEVNHYAIQGKVVWITPAFAQLNKPMGIGLQFVAGNGQALKLNIEAHLASMLNCNEMTYTI